MCAGILARFTAAKGREQPAPQRAATNAAGKHRVGIVEISLQTDDRFNCHWKIGRARLPPVRNNDARFSAFARSSMAASNAACLARRFSGIGRRRGLRICSLPHHRRRRRRWSSNARQPPLRRSSWPMATASFSADFVLESTKGYVETFRRPGLLRPQCSGSDD